MGEALVRAESGDGIENGSEADLAMGALAPGSTSCRAVAIGYNHDVPHRGRIYHVQTEDSGRGRRRISTHVFHAGTIIASSRIHYDDAASVPDVIGLLQQSHKSMMRRLVQGSLDDSIVRRLGEPPRPPSTPVARPRPAPDDRACAALRTRLQALIDALDMDGIARMLGSLRDDVAGTLGVALVDYESGMCLGTSGDGIDLDVAAAGNMDVMKAKARVMRVLGITGDIEDILITLDSQYDIIRPIGTTVSLYLAMDRQQGNLALARHKLATAAAGLKVWVSDLQSV